ncbi:DUF5057 domain-containing protein [Clostridium sp. MSJ-8]|uniref:DUF5057 domain-containing protein n=1 Tax=Clostridium sp. MSJ-8 TaxID=2841510 RepID=UPI001C0ECE56|nr:DUF5057 domain-containing protein [Clostridium sp. MSJ-8]MBU5488059.1 DUF5057 domain-containing protein [Clostridium sp. MSJ-8]
MRSGNNKFFKLIKNKVTWIVIIAVIATLITIPNIRTKADVIKNTVKLLEVEPGDKFQLQSGTYENIKVEVSHIDMPTFVSMVDELSGQYDIICIGNCKNGKDGATLNTMWGDTKDFRYRQYVAESSDINHFGYMYFNYNYSWATGGALENERARRSLWYASSGFVPNNNTSGKWIEINDYASYNLSIKNEKINFLKAKYSVDANDDGTKETYQFVMDEYYSGNDITNRRAKQVINFIESNQLVYLDRSAISIDKTKLYSNFNKYIKSDIRDNVQCTGGLDMTTIIKKYKSLDNASPVVTIKQQPKSYKDMSTIETNRNIKIGFTVKGDSSKKYKAKLYIDSNNDGQFLDDESKKNNCEAVALVDVNNIDESEVNYIEYTVPHTFVGYLSWKLVVFEAKDGDVNDKFTDDSTRIKTYVTGNCAYKADSSETNSTINVLQLLPDNATVTLNMSTGKVKNNTEDTSFKNKLDDVKNKLGIDIQVTAIKMSEFTSKIDKSGLSAKEYANSLINNEANDYGKKFDMIVIGFGDNATLAAGDVFSTKSVEVLQECNNMKMALMFTHDTISLNVLDEVDFYDVKYSKYSDKGYVNPTQYYCNNVAPSKTLTQGFKNLVGQSVYEDPFDSSTWGDEHYLTVGTGLKNRKDELIGGNADGLASLGATPFANLMLYSYNGGFDTEDGDPTTKGTQTKKVIGVNEAQITSYPYNLNDKLGRDYTKSDVSKNQVNSNCMDIAMTHTQWYQLNLEKEDLVPWINLYGTPMNMGDSRNAYYTYNIGNITYSGSGHSDITGEAELELFINTIIKAMDGANIKPEIFNHYYDSEKEISNGSTISVDLGEDYNFKVRLYDADSKENDDIRYTVSLGSETLKNETVKYAIDRYNNKGMFVDCIIPADKLSNYVGQTVTVTTQAIDKYGAESDIKTFNLSIKIPQLKADHGVNKLEVNNENFVIKNSPLNNNKYSEGVSESWNNLSDKFINDIPRDYQSIIPFVACAKVYKFNTRLQLELDSKFGDEEDNRAYVGTDATEPTAYCVTADGNLSEIGTLTYDASSKTYYIDVNGSSLAGCGGQFSEDGTCPVVIKYYAKVNKIQEDSKTIYVNTLNVFINNEYDTPNVSKPATIYVDYSEINKEIDGLLY